MKSSMRIELYYIPLFVAILSFIAGLFFRHTIVGLAVGIIGLEGCALAWIALKVGTTEIENLANIAASRIMALIHKPAKPDEE